ncbi:MAG: NAD(P)-dependent glycerol-3-phosphate dehydrogenase [Acidobacteria bacterium]|nr:NAD(P)-dependent glycerol-3-phosphate dehydrogenase [Acidobacteriota bacterium]
MSWKLGVVGAGSWGTALAVHFADAGHDVLLWARDRDLSCRLAKTRDNHKYLPGVVFPKSLHIVRDLVEVHESAVVLVVVPSHGFRSTIKELLAAAPDPRVRAGLGAAPVTIVSATKGVETETSARMSQVCAEEASAVGREIRFAVLSGPTFAAELARGAPTAAVVASEAPGLAKRLREELATPRFRLYSSSDVVGVELAGAAKNVIAVAAGVVAGLELGHNTVAALITRGLHEMTRLGVACGGEERTFSGLAGLGDLVLTCTGGLSRNRRAGMALAAGKSLAEIEAETAMVAEGIRNSRSLTGLARRQGIEMPIADQMMRVLYEDKDPREALEELMNRERKSEHEL